MNMNKLTMWLGIALAVQLTIAGGLLASDRQSQANSAAQPLLAFEPDNLDKIVIGTDESSVTLAKVDGDWRLGEEKKLPASDSKLEGLIDQLEDTKAGWPVAKTESSQERLEVADDNYQKRLQLYSGDKLLSELYLGTSPSYRKLHVRRAGEDEVYSVKLNSYDLATKSDDWLDKDLLKMEEISRIDGDDFGLQQVEDNWAFVKGDEAQETLELDLEKAKELASALSGLRVQGVAEQAPDELPVQIAVSGSGGNVKYRFAEKDNKYYVARDDVDAVFTLSKYDYERITKFNRNQLAKQQATTEEENKAENS